VVKTAKSKSYLKSIVCLEAFWTHDIENHLSVKPILELASKKYYTRSVHLSCNTLEELAFNLTVAPNRNGYSILYLAFHGYPGGIHMPGVRVEIETIAEFMGKRFSNWVVHFGSCSTLKIEKRRIFDFMKETNILMAIGYKKSVVWEESAAVDLLLFSSIQHYRNMRRFWSGFKKAYRPLVRLTGMEAFFNKEKGRR
jgi:hypothetical protein